jgi:hypothetical protein
VTHALVVFESMFGNTATSSRRVDGLRGAGGLRVRGGETGGTARIGALVDAAAIVRGEAGTIVRPA